MHPYPFLLHSIRVCKSRNGKDERDETKKRRAPGSHKPCQDPLGPPCARPQKRFGHNGKPRHGERRERTKREKREQAGVGERAAAARKTRAHGGSWVSPPTKPDDFGDATNSRVPLRHAISFNHHLLLSYSVLEASESLKYHSVSSVQGAL